MKNLFIFMLGILLCCSCSSYESSRDIEISVSDKNHNEAQFVSVNSQMDSLNYSMFNDDVHTRGIKGIWKRLFAVVISDASGAIFGLKFLPGTNGAVGAIAASGLAAVVGSDRISFNAPVSRTMMSDSVQMNPSNIALSTYIIPSKRGNNIIMSKMDSIGYFHNKVLMELKESLTPNGFVMDTLFAKVADVTCEYYGEPAEKVRKSLNDNRIFFDKLVRLQKTVLNECNDIHGLVDAWKKQFPEQRQELDTMEKFLNGIAHLKVEENDGEYLNKVLEIIDNSNFDDNKKSELRSAFIVGNASYQLWNTEK